MMTYNNNYSDYYDILYADKNYRSEAVFISENLEEYSTNKDKKLLSLGCGTCNYEILFAKMGYKVTGIDRSGPMLKMATKKIKAAGLKLKIDVFKKDVRNFKFKGKFDNAMAMFNIVGLQTKDSDFNKMLTNVSNSLKVGGIFMFDCWYLPAVLKDRPNNRIKIIKTKKGGIIRITRSALHPKKNTIAINFDILETVNNEVINEVNEVHLVRFWSLKELNASLNKAGFSIVKTCNFMKAKSKISNKNWNIFVIARKKV